MVAKKERTRRISVSHIAAGEMGAKSLVLQHWLFERLVAEGAES